MLVVANARVFGGGFRIAPGADLDGRPARRRRLREHAALGAGWRSCAGCCAARTAPTPAVAVARGASFRLRFAAPPAYETDGEWNRAASSAELTVDAVPRALRVLAPRALSGAAAVSMIVQSSAASAACSRCLAWSSCSRCPARS